jgi:hypothetical protein
MLSYYVRFGRRHRLPSTLEILDELRSAYLPGYVRKSWAQQGFKRPPDSTGDIVESDAERAPATDTEQIRKHAL